MSNESNDSYLMVRFNIQKRLWDLFSLLFFFLSFIRIKLKETASERESHREPSRARETEKLWKKRNGYFPCEINSYKKIFYGIFCNAIQSSAIPKVFFWFFYFWFLLLLVLVLLLIIFWSFLHVHK